MRPAAGINVQEAFSIFNVLAKLDVIGKLEAHDLFIAFCRVLYETPEIKL